MTTLTKLSAFLVGLLMILAAFSPALALTSSIAAPRMIIESINGSSVTSSNWSGYAVTATPGSVTYASGSWIVPAVTGTSNSYAACWTGIDGYSSSTVEQTGTISYMNGNTPTYYAWYEFYPFEAIVQINLIKGQTADTVSAGDTIFASVTYSTPSSVPTFTLYIDDITAKWTYSEVALVSTLTKSEPTPALSSAEWIVEAPTSGRSILPLANFGTAYFGQDNTGVLSPANCYATIGTTTAPIGSLTAVSGTAIYTITMSDGNAKATPSTLTAEESFSVAYSTVTRTPPPPPTPPPTPPPHHHGDPGR